tara:strand:+ start:344 stop:1549 length:1206 start_codon:yes stop_codon:yes gene_type:complete
MPLTQVKTLGIGDNTIKNEDIDPTAGIALSKLASTPALLTGTTNNELVTVTGANAITGESTLTYTGTILQQKQTGDTAQEFIFDSNRSSANNTLGGITGYWDTDRVADILFYSGADTTNKDDGYITLRTSTEQGSITERMRIASDGKIGIADTNPGRSLDVKNGVSFGFAGTNSGYPWLGSTPVLSVSTDGNNGTAGDYAANAIFLVGRGGSGISGTTYGGVAVSKELFRVNMGGEVVISDGNLKIGNGGFGVDFGAQTSSSTTGITTSSEVLDHYEEGTWVPVNDNLPITNNNTAQYTRIGNLVHVSFNITFAASPADTSQSGGVISNLPFTCQSQNVYFTPQIYHGGNAAMTDIHEQNILCKVNGGDNHIIIYSFGSSTTATRAHMASKGFYATFTYTV